MPNQHKNAKDTYTWIDTIGSPSHKRDSEHVSHYCERQDQTGHRSPINRDMS